jgi:translation initiation factor 3 subunit G
MRLVTEAVEPEVALRRTWKKFGLSANDGVGPNISSTILGEPVFLKLSMEADFDKQEVSPAQAKAAEAKTIKCKYCDGPHYSVRCPYKDTFAGEDKKFSINGASSGSAEAVAASAGSPGAGPTKYVPKFKRSVEEGGLGGNSSDLSSPLDDRDQGLAIRITNLSDVVVESDIRELVGAIGVPVARCNVGRDRNTGRCKGYAFVNFYAKEDAEKVMGKLNGFPYGNLILKVEIARPVEK